MLVYYYPLVLKKSYSFPYFNDLFMRSSYPLIGALKNTQEMVSLEIKRLKQNQPVRLLHEWNSWLALV